MKKSTALFFTAAAIIAAVFAIGILPYVRSSFTSSAPPPARSTQSAPSGPSPDQTYSVRARIDALPIPDRHPLSLHHEEMKEFVGKSGEVVGMKEMIMPFNDLAPGVSLDGFKVDDLVEVTFEVRWKTSPRMLITKLVRLPAGTSLNIGKVIESGK